MRKLFLVIPWFLPQQTSTVLAQDYTVTAAGYNGNVTVALTIEDGAIGSAKAERAGDLVGRESRRQHQHRQSGHHLYHRLVPHSQPKRRGIRCGMVK